MSALHNVTVLGSGVLGGQIAWHSAFTGKTVALYDIDDAALERCRAAHEQYAAIYLAGQGATEADIAATRSRLSFTTDLASAVADADVVIEAVPEIPEVKSDVYAKLAPLLPDRTIVATNSSSLLPSTFADVTGRPDKFCALHFGNGIWDMNLAEIMGHAGTAKQTLLEITEFAIEIGMVPIPVLKESNGYVLNGWSIPLTRAALSLVVTGVSTPEDVDRTFMKLGGSAFGPFGLTDMVGLETIYNLSVYWGSIDQDEEHLAIAAYVKENFLDKGRLGLQSGQGFYSWPNPAYLQPGFLDVPDVSAASTIVDLITQN